MKIIWWLGLSICSGICYRFGGSAKKGGWFDFLRNTKTRDIGCPLVTYVYLLTLWHPVNFAGWGLLLVTFGLTFGALTTYWDWLFGQDNFYAHGFAIGIACLPLFWAGIGIWAIIARSLALGLFMGLWSKFWGWDVMEEGGRGFVLPASIPLLLL